MSQKKVEIHVASTEICAAPMLRSYASLFKSLFMIKNVAVASMVKLYGFDMAILAC